MVCVRLMKVFIQIRESSRVQDIPLVCSDHLSCFCDLIYLVQTVDPLLEQVLKDCQLFEEALNHVNQDTFIDDFITKFILSNLKAPRISIYHKYLRQKLLDIQDNTAFYTLLNFLLGLYEKLALELSNDAEQYLKIVKRNRIIKGMQGLMRDREEMMDISAVKRVLGCMTSIQKAFPITL